MYLNTIFYGSQTYGIEAAARTYFKSNAHDLTLAQASMLAGLPQAPTQYNPLINLTAAKKRQLEVLKAMVENHYITKAEADAAYATKLTIYHPTNHFEAPHFVDYVLQTLRTQFHIQPSDRKGYRVYTSLDLNLQHMAEQVVRDQIAQKGNYYNFHDAALVSMDPKTGEIKYYPLAPEWNYHRVQLNFVGLRHDVDGKVWTKNVGTVDVFRLDLASGKWERFHPTDFLPPGHRYSIYQLISDSKNNVWMAEFEEGYLGKIDAKTLKVTWFPLPSPHWRARRMEIDDQDRILLTEYRANKIALFDTKTEQFTEYDLPPWTYPYRAQVDKLSLIHI